VGIVADKLLHKAAQRLAAKINVYSNKEGLELTKMVIGVEMLLINISKLVIIYLLAALLGLMLHTLLIHGSFIMAKRFSYGLHALSNVACALVSCVLFVAIPWLLSGFGIGNMMVVFAYIPIIFVLYRYAPADTKARPLVGARRRARLKRLAAACGLASMAIALLLPDQSLKLLFTLGAVYQCVSILPLTYKILGRSERNYEKYECA
jgi:accessory gene regulator B